MNTLITFSTYPTVIFGGAVKLVLFTIIPAGFIVYLPVQLLREVSPSLVLGLLACSSAQFVLAVIVFHAGLRRYESGNLVLMRD